MKKRNKLIVIIVLIILMIIAVKYIYNSERRVKNFVINNNEELVTIAEAYLNGDTSITTYKGAKVERVYGGDHVIVQFFYGGFGIAPASRYYGFYYSPDDAPTVYQNSPRNELVDGDDQQWIWTDGTDNGGRTFRITDNWFYYEAWF
ncbi:MAG: hypothetical protein PWP16_1221 [Eubacteriaceae bacterium]|nr:hypothetical protein [Eubacteriaceae bacterium]